MSPKVKDMLTDKEEDLIEIAVQLDYVIHYWECALANGVHITDAWYEQCIGNEMDSVNKIFDEHGRDSLGTPYVMSVSLFIRNRETKDHKEQGG
ncbi:hypothetical protein EI94DRAFT_1807358 [Lactarius quietus]|nr:hypothetical protein EI94DRAFT_1807358 [Lactarius quietus]